MPIVSGVIPGAPVALTEKDRQFLRYYFDQELEEALRAHERKMEWIDESNRLYMGEPLTKRKTFPWDGAANLVVPLVGITVDSIVARIMNTIFAVQPFWSSAALIKDLEPVVHPLQDFMEWSRVNELDMYMQTRSWIMEVVKHGWAYLKVYWTSFTQRTFQVQARRAVPVDAIIRKPSVEHILLQDIICQAGIEDELVQSEWIAQRIRLTDGELAWRKHDRVYEDTDIIIKAKEHPTPLEEKLAENEFEALASRPREKLNTLYEMYADLPVAGSELPVPIMVTFHKESRTIARCVYNPDITGARPFFKGKFLDREGKREGIGISRQLQLIQEEISTIHNQQVDNATLANTRFFIGRRGVVRNGTRVWPGRFLTVPDPSRDVITLPMADIYQACSNSSSRASRIARGDRALRTISWAVKAQLLEIGQRRPAHWPSSKKAIVASILMYAIFGNAWEVWVRSYYCSTRSSDRQGWPTSSKVATGSWWSRRWTYLTNSSPMVSGSSSRPLPRLSTAR